MSLFGDLPLWRQALRGIGAILCNLIYSLISWIYQLFMVVSRLNILSSDQVAPIYQRVTMILTIVMTFYITFEFVKYVIQPDNFSDKEKGVGNIAFRMIMVVILIAFVPRIFTLAYRLQNTLIENQVISKVILGKKNSDFATLGGTFSSNMLGLFYYVDEDVCKGSCSQEQTVVNNNLNSLASGNSFNIADGINSGKTVNGEDIPTIKFDGFLAIIVGGFIVYILAMYSIDVGTRYAQLIFLQIMAPVAIMGYLAPKKDNIFKKWMQQCLTTYLDLFIRLAIIYFVLLIVEVLGDAYTTGNLFAGISGITTTIKMFTYIVLVMGLLAFAQKAPKMLSELLPNGGSAGIGFGLGYKNRLEPTVKTAGSVARGTGRTLAAARAPGLAVAEAIRNKTGVWSAVKGTGTGLKNALGKNGSYSKSAQAIRQSVQKDTQTKDSGGTPLKADLFGGYEDSRAKRQDLAIQQLERGKENKKNIRASVDDYADVGSIKSAYESARQGGAPQIEIDSLYDQYKKARNAMVKANANGAAKAGNYEYTYTKKSYEYEYEYEVDAAGNQIKDINGNAIIKKDANGNAVKKIKLDENGNAVIKEEKVKNIVRVGDGEVATYSERTHNMIERTKEMLKDTALGDFEIGIEVEKKDANGNVIKDENGNPKKEIIKKAIKDMTLDEYAAYIGDIGDLVDTEITKIKNSDEYREAHANAANSGKK